MSNVFASPHPLVAHKLSRLRDKNTEPKKFRELVREISALLAYEATADLAVTPRELETLRWTMEGKTAWEVGRVLGITERTVALHVNNATHKLGCVNKHQAVLKALKMGLIR